MLYLQKNNRMKHTFLFAALSATLLFSNHSDAQVPVVSAVLPKVIIGVKVGANLQQLTGDSWKSSYNAGLVGGAFVGLTKKKIGVQGELLVRSAKFDTKGDPSNPSVSIKTLSLDVPVLLEYRFIPRLWLQLGPQFSAIISAKVNSTDVKKMFNSTDFAGVVGLQAMLPMHFTAGARYVLGMTNIRNESYTGVKESWNNRSIQVYLGFRFL